MANGLGSDPANTKGRRALAKILSNGVSQGDMGRVLNVAQAMVSQWASGKRRPSPMYRRKFARTYGIPETDWMTREEFIGVREAG